MAKNRYVNTKYWTDTYIIEHCNPIDKLFFLYLITNPHTDISGIYELSIKMAAIETGIDKDNIEKVIIPKFERDQKIMYRDGWIAIKNFAKHQKLNPSVIKGIENGIKNAPLELVQFTGCDRLVHLNSNININSNINTNINTNINKNTKPKKKPKSTHSPPKEYFDLFWEKYPKKINKKRASKEFEKLNVTKELLDEILEHLEKRIKTTWMKENKLYVVYPERFLKDERWKDDLSMYEPMDTEETLNLETK